MSRAVIVTGAAGGIGAALCERMRKDGYTTIGIDKDVAPAADVYLQVDLSESEQLVDLGRELAGDYKLKAVVHNGAVQPIAGAGETPFDVWTNALRVNVIAVDALMSGTHENLAVNNGSIVVISSVHGRATTGGITAYATTKAALEGWVRSAAMDLGPSIRVNAIAPGAIDTAKLREGFARWGETAEERKALLRQRTALRRIGEPSDVAGAVSFLIGDDARFITGTVLVVDGGATARLGSE
ncbi:MULTISPECIES: SDR family NAD(P)-dependent oxidoreductase [Mycobacterium]|uniref:SDR family NAD(P)-dependent oxidoreductase n=1 Tax=Mycobacterium TaxID=1763 RepID=UPI00025D53A0|nr:MULTISPECIES: SDR family oxidoreductase [Mycobacterium]AFJ36037.1 short-chain dehydrogenase/reductase SDR [Mycobacterium sp. MOTT36Y]ELR85790.1 short-chain dehydrogenase/reductase SDR [Mycobacterium sp. H4Y]MCA2275561.1 SDR family oxidoreductase [Mycobacterium intracellulare]MCA2326377.1 SDR family oxidoreductase [Mycobacterium intracellulare]OCB15981.1 short-chain dehydrogenase [Mycobacterium intracellulare subsp. yongonense]